MIQSVVVSVADAVKMVLYCRNDAIFLTKSLFFSCRTPPQIVNTVVRSVLSFECLFCFRVVVTALVGPCSLVVNASRRRGRLVTSAASVSRKSCYSSSLRSSDPEPLSIIVLVVLRCALLQQWTFLVDLHRNRRFFDPRSSFGIFRKLSSPQLNRSRLA